MRRREFLATTAAIAAGATVASPPLHGRGSLGPVGPPGPIGITGEPGNVGPPGPCTLQKTVVGVHDGIKLTASLFGIASHLQGPVDALQGYPEVQHSLVLHTHTGVGCLTVEIFDLTSVGGILQATGTLELIIRNARNGRKPAAHPQVVRQLLAELIERIDPSKLRRKYNVPRGGSWSPLTEVTEIC